jgi:hypothetical protein
MPFAAGLSAANMTIALCIYLSLIGFSEFCLGSRMLFLGYRENHPAHLLSQDWRSSMDLPRTELATQPAPAAAAFASAFSCSPELTCGPCPATSICLDSNISAQIAGILHTHQPAIVSSVRATTLLAHR